MFRTNNEATVGIFLVLVCGANETAEIEVLLMSLLIFLLLLS
jgi:hypothetical protein